MAMFNSLGCPQEFEKCREDDLNTSKLVEIQWSPQWRCNAFLFVEQRISAAATTTTTTNIHTAETFLSAMIKALKTVPTHTFPCVNLSCSPHVPAVYNAWHEWPTNQNRIHIFKRQIYSYSI